MKKINPQIPNNVEGSPTQPPIGFCFPCHSLRRARGARKDLDPQLNPFPLLPDARSACMFVPIGVCWLPAPRRSIRKIQHKDVDKTYLVTALIHRGSQMIDFLLRQSHESVHIFLTNTSLSTYAIFLLQCQLIAIVLAISKGYQIRIPSLNEPLGYIAKAQEALDTIDVPVALIQELMAVTLVPFYLERGCIPLTSQFLRLSGKSFDEVFARQEKPKLLDHFVFSLLNDALQEALLQRVRQLTGETEPESPRQRQTWLASYSRSFPGYDFPRLHQKLMVAWRKIADSVETNQWYGLVTALARYPLQVPPSPLEQFFIPHSLNSLNALLDLRCSYVVQMSQQPLTRLNTMLDVIEKAEGLQGLTAWKNYLLAELPGLESPLWVLDRRNEQSYLQSLNVKKLWDEFGLPDAGELFANLYAQPAEIKAQLFSLPLFQDRDSTELSQELTILVQLEVMRQALIALRYMAKGGRGLSFDGLRCLCAPDVRPRCYAKEGLNNFWEIVVPDEGDSMAEKVFKDHWQKLACV